MGVRRGARRRAAATVLALALVAGAVGACQDDGNDADDVPAPTTDAADARPQDDAGEEPERATNVVLIVGDGMGIAQRELVRLTTVGQDGELAMGGLRYQGWSRTDPDDPERAVTDSAAAATALATGHRTSNGAIAVDVDGNPLPTLLERAAQAGKVTGLVTTADVTDATPAAFAAHAADRGEQSEIARQYLEEAQVEVILGGGEDQWYPPGTEGAWPDHPSSDPGEESSGEAGDLVARAEELGYQYVTDAEGLAAAEAERILGLFANEDMFEYDDELEAVYDPVVPLPVMAAKALEVLSGHPDGFFLVIEEEGIDAMAHRGDAELLIEAGRALDETVALVREFAAEHGETLVVVVGDHATGGMAIDPAGSEAEPGESSENGPFVVAGTDLLVDVKWTTGGHTAAATPVSAEGPGAEALVDVRHHTDVHDLVLAAMGLDGG